jgi:hydroxymethylpyrimidine/phosphomethylpyrimidine kinase
MNRSCVLVFAGSDPSGGAGIQADIGAIAALLTAGRSMADAIDLARAYRHQALESAYAIAGGQRIPDRSVSLLEENT